MIRAAASCVLALATWLSATVVVSALHAQPATDDAAQKAVAQAVEHYLATEFERAERMLLETIESCGGDCRPRTIARAWMYVGIIRSAVREDEAAALRAFQKALSADATIELDRDLATELTRRAFARAHQGIQKHEEAKHPAPPRPEPMQNVEEYCPPGIPACVHDGGRCTSSSECQPGLNCVFSAASRRSICQRGAPEPRQTERHLRHWFGFHVGMGFALLTDDASVCALSARVAYRCYHRGRPYPSAEDAPDGDTPGGVLSGGFIPATWRSLVSYNLALTEHLHAGGRAGFAFDGAPDGFLPLHLEARLGLWPLHANASLRPTLFGLGGVAQFDARIPIEVLNRNSSSGTLSREVVTAYAPFGRWFVGAGAGVAMLPAPNIMFEVELSALRLFPDAAWVLFPNLGVAVGVP